MDDILVRKHLKFGWPLPGGRLKPHLHKFDASHGVGSDCLLRGSTGFSGPFGLLDH
jgi:hypothetical protein